MLIILEGSDGVGKSHITKLLVRELHSRYPSCVVDVLHARPPKSHPLDEYELPLLRYRPGARHHVICDRWHLGEWIYPQILGRKTKANTPVYHHINMFLASRGAVLVHVDTADDKIRERVRNRGDDLVTADQAAQAAQEYRKLISTVSHVPIIKTTDQPLDLIIPRIIVDGQNAESGSQLLGGFTTYIGTHKPKYLILGDVRGHLKGKLNTSDAADDHSPAFMPYVATSGHFLLSHLPTDIVYHCGLANACDVDNVEELWVTLGQPATVALGVNASRQAVWAVRCDHPQYVRRFFSAHGSAYGQRVRAALVR